MGKVRVQFFSADNRGEREVSYEEALQIVAEAQAQGRAAIDRKTGRIIEKLGPETDDILLVDLVDGG